MQFADLWYFVALSDQLQPNTVLARSLLGEWLAIFRGEDGQAVALRDQCLQGEIMRQLIQLFGQLLAPTAKGFYRALERPKLTQKL